MRPWWWGEANTERAARLDPMCSPDDHEWRRYSYGGVPIVVICHLCGRAPLEALDETVVTPDEKTRNRVAATAAR